MISRVTTRLGFTRVTPWEQCPHIRSDRNVMTPNLLWITDDQHHADCFGHAARSQVRTPTIDRMVRGGVNFTRSYSVASECVPSRMSMLTGMYVHSHGVYNGMVDVPDRLTSLPQTLREQLGTRTAITGKKHYGRWRNEPFETDTGETDAGYTRGYLKGLGLFETFEREYLARCADFMAYTSQIPYEHSMTEWATNETIAKIDELGEQPFCIWANYGPPHPPYCNAFDSPHRVDPDEVDLDQIPHRDSRDLQSIDRRRGAARLGVENAWRMEVTGEETYRIALANYYGQCAAVDAGVGRLLEHLEKRGILENTIVLFNSDHGDFAGEYNRLGKCTVGQFECIQRIPTVWYWKRHFGPERIESFVENIDIFPMVCDLLGAETPCQVQGQSYASVLNFSGSGPGPAPHTGEIAFFDNSSVKGLRTRRYRLSYCHGRENWGELYDLQEDSEERHNRFDDPGYAAARGTLMRELLNWMIRTEQPVGIDVERGNMPPSRWYSEHPIAKAPIVPNSDRFREGI